MKTEDTVDCPGNRQKKESPRDVAEDKKMPASSIRVKGEKNDVIDINKSTVKPAFDCAAEKVSDKQNEYKTYSRSNSIKHNSTLCPIELAIERLSSAEKAAFLEARQKAPHLVKKESDISRFFRLANQDIEIAVKLVASYWTKRKEIFQQRAFLPLDQTGEGALSRSDVMLLNQGFLMMLPNTKDGYSVLCCDPSRISKSVKDTDLRVAFYWFSLLAENNRSQEEGFLLLYLIDKSKTTKRDRRQPLAGVMSVLPIRIKEVHALTHTASRTSKQAVIDSVGNMFGLSSVGKVVVYYDTKKDDVLGLLEQNGLPRTILPKAVGGTWGYEDFVQWQELRTRLEWDLPPGVGMSKQATELFDFSAIKNHSDLSDEEKLERKRRMNVLHSRRKRERERIEVGVLQERCDELEDKNDALRSENARYESVLEEVKAKVARLHDFQSPSKCSLAHQDSTTIPASQQASSISQSQISNNSSPALDADNAGFASVLKTTNISLAHHIQSNILSANPDRARMRTTQQPQLHDCSPALQIFSEAMRSDDLRLDRLLEEVKVSRSQQLSPSNPLSLHQLSTIPPQTSFNNSRELHNFSHLNEASQLLSSLASSSLPQMISNAHAGSPSSHLAGSFPTIAGTTLPFGLEASQPLPSFLLDALLAAQSNSQSLHTGNYSISGQDNAHVQSLLRSSQLLRQLQGEREQAILNIHLLRQALDAQSLQQILMIDRLRSSQAQSSSASSDVNFSSKPEH